MQVKFRALPKEVLATWNAEWPAGSWDTTKKLRNALQSYVRKKMGDLQVSIKKLGSWLSRNGWTKKIAKGKWRKKDGLANHRVLYIDFMGDPLRLSKLTFTKNVIFVNRGV